MVTTGLKVSFVDAEKKVCYVIGSFFIFWFGFGLVLFFLEVRFSLMVVKYFVTKSSSLDSKSRRSSSSWAWHAESAFSASELIGTFGGTVTDRRIGAEEKYISICWILDYQYLVYISFSFIAYLFSVLLVKYHHVPLHYRHHLGLLCVDHQHLQTQNQHPCDLITRSFSVKEEPNLGMSIVCIAYFNYSN